MRTLAVILFTLIVLPVYSQLVQLENDVYKVTVKDADFTIYFDRAPYQSKYYDIVVESINRVEKQKVLTGIITQLNKYSANVLKYVPAEFYIVSKLIEKSSGDAATAVCWGTVKIAFIPVIAYSDYPNTFHHEIFHAIFNHFNDDEILEKSLKISNFENIPTTIYWDKGNPYYPLGFSGEYGLRCAKNKNIEEDVASIFGELMMKNSTLKKFVIENPNTILAQKTEYVIQFLQNVDSKLNIKYFASIID